MFLQKWGGAAGAPVADYPVFMAVSSRSGKDNRGRYVFRIDGEGRLVDDSGIPVVESGRAPAVDTDLDGIADAFAEWCVDYEIHF